MFCLKKLNLCIVDNRLLIFRRKKIKILPLPVMTEYLKWETDSYIVTPREYLVLKMVWLLANCPCVATETYIFYWFNINHLIHITSNMIPTITWYHVSKIKFWCVKKNQRKLWMFKRCAPTIPRNFKFKLEIYMEKQIRQIQLRWYLILN